MNEKQEALSKQEREVLDQLKATMKELTPEQREKVTIFAEAAAMIAGLQHQEGGDRR